MPAPAVFGINNSGVNLAVNLVLLCVAVIYLALVYWTFADARRRISDPVLIGLAVITSLVPFVGTIVYVIVRPPEFLDDVRERELEIQAAEARLAQVGYHLCPHCDYEVEKDYLRCPNCMRKLKDPCRNCGKPLDPAWKLCPYCEAEVGAMPAARRVRRRREAPAAGEPVPRDPVPREPRTREPVARDPALIDPGPRSTRREAPSGDPVAREPVTRQAAPEPAASEKRSSTT